MDQFYCTELGMQKTELVYFVIFNSFLLTWSDCELNRPRLLLRYIIFIINVLLKYIVLLNTIIFASSSYCSFLKAGFVLSIVKMFPFKCIL